MNTLILTDIENPVTTASHLIDYGVIGIFCLLLIGAVYWLSRQFLKLHEQNVSRIKELEKRLEQYMIEDREALLETINDCKNVISNNNELVKEYKIFLEKIMRNEL